VWSFLEASKQTKNAEGACDARPPQKTAKKESFKPLKTKSIKQ